MDYRLLPSNEWYKIADSFRSRGCSLPDPQYADIVVAEDHGTIVAYVTKQIVVHCEPVWVDDAYRGRAYWIWRQMMKVIGTAGCYVFGTSSARERVLKRAGFEQLPYTVFFQSEQH